MKLRQRIGLVSIALGCAGCFGFSAIRQAPNVNVPPALQRDAIRVRVSGPADGALLPTLRSFFHGARFTYVDEVSQPSGPTDVPICKLPRAPETNLLIQLREEMKPFPWTPGPKCLRSSCTWGTGGSPKTLDGLFPHQICGCDEYGPDPRTDPVNQGLQSSIALYTTKGCDEGVPFARYSTDLWVSYADAAQKVESALRLLFPAWNGTIISESESGAEVALADDEHPREDASVEIGDTAQAQREGYVEAIHDRTASVRFYRSRSPTEGPQQVAIGNRAYAFAIAAPEFELIADRLAGAGLQFGFFPVSRGFLLSGTLSLFHGIGRSSTASSGYRGQLSGGYAVWIAPTTAALYAQVGGGGGEVWPAAQKGFADVEIDLGVKWRIRDAAVLDASIGYALGTTTKLSDQGQSFAWSGAAVRLGAAFDISP